MYDLCHSVRIMPKIPISLKSIVGSDTELMVVPLEFDEIRWNS
jgi:hypothetical protein